MSQGDRFLDSSPDFLIFTSIEEIANAIIRLIVTVQSAPRIYCDTAGVPWQVREKEVEQLRLITFTVQLILFVTVQFRSSFTVTTVSIIMIYRG